MFDPIINGKLNRHIKECGNGGGTGGGLPVVELETVATAEIGMLSFNDIEKLQAVNYALPCIMKCKIDVDGSEMPFTLLAHGRFAETEGGIQYGASAVADFGFFGGRIGVMIISTSNGFAIMSISDQPSEE